MKFLSRMFRKMPRTGSPGDEAADYGEGAVSGRLSRDIQRIVDAFGNPDDLTVRRVEGAGRLYCDMLTETLLAQKQPAIEAVVGQPLWPSYSYARLHHRGSMLAPHRDREASEIAVTVAIGGDRQWPIWFKTPAGDISFALEPGDAVVYDGRKLSHWREPFQGDIQIQCMLFYVTRNGPHAAERYDGRPGVGCR